MFFPWQVPRRLTYLAHVTDLQFKQEAAGTHERMSKGSLEEAESTPQISFRGLDNGAKYFSHSRAPLTLSRLSFLPCQVPRLLVHPADLRPYREAGRGGPPAPHRPPRWVAPPGIPPRQPLCGKSRRPRAVPERPLGPGLLPRTVGRGGVRDARTAGQKELGPQVRGAVHAPGAQAAGAGRAGRAAVCDGGGAGGAAGGGVSVPAKHSTGGVQFCRLLKWDKRTRELDEIARTQLSCQAFCCSVSEFRACCPR